MLARLGDDIIKGPATYALKSSGSALADNTMATARSENNTPAETQIRCLQNFGGGTLAFAVSLQRDTQWSAEYGLATRNSYAYDLHETNKCIADIH